MCGICGFLTKRRPDFDAGQILKQMNDAIAHRGPDGEGFWVADSVFLGHRRLSIIDLAGGAQPLANEDGTVVTVFNGEIYNYTALRAELELRGHHFRTRSDTEVLVHLWEDFGEALCEHIDGMAAFAIWDQKKHTLFLGRDRLGKKPLYWADTPAGFLFASELGALLANPLCPRELSKLSLRRYLLFDSVPAPDTILEGVHKLEPGCSLLYRNGVLTQRRYWDLSFPPKDQPAPPMEEACASYRSLLLSAVEKRLMSEVPLGIFLSGGIDSSAVVAATSKLLDGPDIQTFSIGFEDPSFDESSYAEAVAKNFGTTHHHKVLSPELMLHSIDRIMGHLDEPLADNSLLPTYLLCNFARERVTVALGGDGGDELALGYPTFKAHKIARWYGMLPGPVQAAVATSARALPVSHDNISLDYQAKRFVKGMEYDRFSRHFVWIGALAPDEQHPLLRPELLEAADDEAVLDIVRQHLSRVAPRDDFDALSYLYAKLYMCDDILTKADRASMMNSLELRAPLLDTALVDFVTSLPTSYKLHGRSLKHIMKLALGDQLGSQVVRRPKKGFGVPIGKWLRGELFDWASSILSSANIEALGVFEVAGVRRLFEDHMLGRRDNRKPLWSLIVLVLWYQTHIAPGRPRELE